MANITSINGYTIKDSTAASLSSVYPVGAVYISVVSTNPSTLFGGTWEQIKDTFLLACGSSYTNGATGGEATHTLTVEEMPAHTHNYISYRWGCGGDGSGQDSREYSRETTSTGGNQPHNNMPPYLAVYMWKRTA